MIASNKEVHFCTCSFVQTQHQATELSSAVRSRQLHWSSADEQFALTLKEAFLCHNSAVVVDLHCHQVAPKVALLVGQP